MRIALLLMMFAALGRSQNMPPCDGDVVLVRVSQIKPGGTMQKFMAALAAHKAWYRANGVTDNQLIAARVIVRDDKGAMKYSDTEIVSYHINPPGPSRTPNRGDAAWDAYVKLYQDN